MNVYVVTHCVWSSYGSMLQAMGLKKAISSLGFETVLLYDRKPKEYRLRVPRSKKDLVYFPVKLINHRKILSMREKGLNFISGNLDVLYFSDYDDMCRNYPHGGAYIAGSDQIWLPGMDNPSFFLDFVKGKDEKKASYAASLGVSEIPPDKEEKFKRYLAGFDSISVREHQNKAQLEKLTGKQVSVNIDPTFLVDAGEWRKLEKEYPVKGRYILVYTIYWNSSINEKLRMLKQQTGLPVYAVKPSPSRLYSTKTIYGAGPEEFLWLIDHAEYVVTSSFHGAAFASIFNKKVSVVINPKAPSRLTELADRLELPVIDIDKLDSAPPIDYNTVNKNIEQARAEGMDYLKKVLL